MADVTLIDHEQRITRLEDKVEINLTGLVTRVDALEKVINRQLAKEREEKDQEATDARQSLLKEMNELRSKLEEAEKLAQSAKADSVIRDIKDKK